MTATHINWEIVLSGTGDYIIDSDTNEKILDVYFTDDNIVITPHRLFADSIRIKSIDDIIDISIINGLMSIIYFDNVSNKYNKFVDISSLIH